MINKLFYAGATLCMVGAFMVCALNMFVIGSVVIALSNIALFIVAYDAIYQFCRYLMEVAQVKDPEKE